MNIKLKDSKDRRSFWLHQEFPELKDPSLNPVVDSWMGAARDAAAKLLPMKMLFAFLQGILFVSLMANLRNGELVFPILGMVVALGFLRSHLVKRAEPSIFARNGAGFLNIRTVRDVPLTSRDFFLLELIAFKEKTRASGLAALVFVPFSAAGAVLVVLRYGGTTGEVVSFCMVAAATCYLVRTYLAGGSAVLVANTILNAFPKGHLAGRAPAVHEVTGLLRYAPLGLVLGSIPILWGIMLRCSGGFLPLGLVALLPLVLSMSRFTDLGANALREELLAKYAEIEKNWDLVLASSD